MNCSALDQQLSHKSRQISTIKNVIILVIEDSYYYKKNYKKTTKILDIDSKNWYLIYKIRIYITIIKNLYFY